MRVEQLGDGEPEIAIVGGIHGDEPCGPRAIEALLQADPDPARPVKLIVANEEARARNLRYVEEDLNRAFPGAPDADTHEGRLAHDLLAELRDCVVFSMHSTQSYGGPFALCDTVDALTRSACPYLAVDALVETSQFSDGRLIERPNVLEVECGLQGSEAAAENAERLIREFLAAVGALPGEPHEDREVPVYRMCRRIPKRRGDRYEVFAENFERVNAGEAFAAVDGEQLVAEEPFYPILMSSYGYEDVFGYTGELVGKLEPDTEPVPDRR
jgi:succinylglutamate desuccinylase